MSSVTRIMHWDDVPATQTSGVILLRLTGALPGDADRGLQRLRALQVPIVAVLAGPGGPAELAALLLSCVAYVENSGGLTLTNTTALLEYGVAWQLQRRGAGSLLFLPAPLDADDIVTCGVALGASPGAAEATAAYLAADPTKVLLVRALRVAADTSAAQSAAYDRELAQIIRA